MQLSKVCVEIAKVGKGHTGPVLPYEARSTARDYYDPRSLARAASLHHNHQQNHVAPSIYSSRNNGIMKMERPAGEARLDIPYNAKLLPNCGIAAKLAPDIAIDINSHSYYTNQGGGAKMERHDDRVVIDANLLQAKAHYGGLGAGATKVAAHHRKVDMMQYGVARMY